MLARSCRDNAIQMSALAGNCEFKFDGEDAVRMPPHCTVIGLKAELGTTVLTNPLDCTNGTLMTRKVGRLPRSHLHRAGHLNCHLNHVLRGFQEGMAFFPTSKKLTADIPRCFDLNSEDFGTGIGGEPGRAS